jgi:hypothetical protein
MRSTAMPGARPPVAVWSHSVLVLLARAPSRAWRRCWRRRRLADQIWARSRHCRNVTRRRGSAGRSRNRRDSSLGERAAAIGISVAAIGIACLRQTSTWASGSSSRKREGMVDCQRPWMRRLETNQSCRQLLGAGEPDIGEAALLLQAGAAALVQRALAAGTGLPPSRAGRRCRIPAPWRNAAS